MNFHNFVLIVWTYFIFFSFLFAQTPSSIEEDYKMKYEYKFSFKGPHISHTKDRRIPFWDFLFDTVPGDDRVRIVPSLKTKRGAVWSLSKFPHEEWKVEMWFRITGRGIMGADGLALWYVESPSQSGPVFGSADQWKGVGILFDSFDNDRKKNNPYISILVNDGTMSYDHAIDGYNIIEHGCKRDFRNRPYPVKVKLIYANRNLQLYIDSGNTVREFYEPCASISNVVLPSNYYFGVSAATGDMADDHDVLKFLAWSLSPKAHEVQSETDQIREKEQEKVQEEYEKTVEEFQSEQKKFQEENPDRARQAQHDPEDLFQGGSSSEAKDVFEVQSEVQRHVAALIQLAEMASAKQEAIVRSLDSKYPPIGDVAKSHEAKNALLKQRLMFEEVMSVQNLLENLKKTTLMLSSRISAASGGIGVGSIDSAKDYEVTRRWQDVKENIDLITSEVKNIEDRESKRAAHKCPPITAPSCAPLGVFVGVAVVEILILLLYFTCKQPSVDPGKKYF